MLRAHTRVHRTCEGGGKRNRNDRYVTHGVVLPLAARYLHKMLGVNGVLSLKGVVDTRDKAVVSVKLDGQVQGATIPLTKAGAVLEDLGLSFTLVVPKGRTGGGRRARSIDVTLGPVLPPRPPQRPTNPVAPWPMSRQVRHSP